MRWHCVIFAIFITFVSRWQGQGRNAIVALLDAHR